MAVHYIDPPRIDSGGDLVRFVAESVLMQLYARSNGSEAVAALDALLATVENDSSSRDVLRAAIEALRGRMRHEGDDERAKRELIRGLLRRLDNHLTRLEPERRVHLVSFYDSTDARTAAELEWVDAQLFAAAWAAGPSRSKHEVLSRGAIAARLSQELGDRWVDGLAKPVQPNDPYAPRSRNLSDLVTMTCDQLIAVASLPPNSGAAAAVRHLAGIGEIALTRIEHAIYGDVESHFPPCALAWRLPRVLTRIGEIFAAGVAADVWGPVRAQNIRIEARRLLGRLLREPAPSLNTPRSLLVEAFRFLDPANPELRECMLARLEVGRAAVRGDDGTVEELRPFGETGRLSSRELEYTAFTLAATCDVKGHDVCRLLLDNLEQRDRSDIGSRAYSAAFVHLMDQRGGESPPLMHYWPRNGQQSDVAAEWIGAAQQLHVKSDLVIGPHMLVWGALRSAADTEASDDGTGLSRSGRSATSERASSNPWKVSRDARRLLGGRKATPLDAILGKRVSLNAREALRALVAQAILTIDGTARREAIEAIRQAGFEDEAAQLIVLVVERLSERRSERLAQRAAPAPELEGWEFDWLLEHAVFALSYVGSTHESAYSTLLKVSGLVGDDHLDRSWRQIRVTALLGLADLSDVLHDDDSDVGSNRLAELIGMLDTRLRQVASSTGRPSTDQGFYVLPQPDELRALVAVIAMLRLPDDTSIQLLHVLSGRSYEHKDGSYDKGSKRQPWEFREPRLVGQRTILAGRATFAARQPGDWTKWNTEYGALLKTWDLVSWQLAEWGLQRIETRFLSTVGDGVRLTDPFRAGGLAAKRQHLMATANNVWCPSE